MGSSLLAARLLRVPLAQMHKKVNGESTKLKYLIYSAHDTQVIHLLRFLGVDLEQEASIPYASTVVFELFKRDYCDGPLCFRIDIRYNGRALNLDFNDPF